MPLLDEVARRIRAIRYETLPAEAIETARFGILDTIGCTLAGASADSTSAMLRTVLPMLAAGPALLLGSRQTCDILNAALINGTASHALDFDDCSNTLGGHPSAPIVPGLWALAEARGADGRAFIAAYVAGFEMETRLARAVNFHHYEKGWHPTATLGVFGAAAACAHLIGLDDARIATALALAASMSSGIKANFGTMAKPFHVGHCTRNGLLAALMAEAGVTASADAFEHRQGFLDVYNGRGNYDAERLLAGWSDPLDIVEAGIAYKRHPCCGSTHPAVDAMLSLRKQHGLRPETVELVESWTHPRRLEHTNRPDPTSGLDGKFSVQYVLARALCEGIVSLDVFGDDDVRDKATRVVMAKVRSSADPDAIMETVEHFYARVRVTTKAGAVHEAFVDRPLGRDRDHPLPAGTLEAKFIDCASQALVRPAAEMLLAALLQLETAASITELSAMMAQPSKDHPAKDHPAKDHPAKDHTV